ncbi:MAG TPA: disulfide bond formation protein DsbA [Cyanobacteria bacterium UBA8543]|nr:disulfide bond formation protein DsbA [Cyanobacteria bacterium UBA8543]
MKLLSSWRDRFPQRVLISIGLVVLCIGLNSCSMPTQAGNSQPIDAQLEAKVLQIIRNHPEVILESVQAYQQKQQEQQQQAQKAFVEGMKANPKSVIGASPTTGSPEQKIVLLEFSDFQCPYCAKAHETLKAFMAKHQNQVTLVYKYLPLTKIHPEALPAAKAAWAASQQGKFWEFYDALFSQQEKLGEPLYVATAKALNLDLKRFDGDRNSEAASAAIKKDLDMAEQLGITGTPFLVMNGQPVSGAIELAELEGLLAKVSKP